jgi:hypothetical protein
MSDGQVRPTLCRFCGAWCKMKSIDIQCDDEAARRLQTVADQWPKCRAPFQTFAAYLATQATRVELTEPSNKPLHSIRYHAAAMAPICSIRLERLARQWPTLPESTQLAIVDCTRDRTRQKQGA